ncbi:hypothetical protein Q1695_005000 [Nippostrongylus brasiliensis]|nr:hypothetical protein Q1695_005000 [Nippostrongylus brasiliensis]
MRRWYKLGFLNDRLELFVHRGDVADPYTLAPSTAKKQSQKLDFTCTSTVSRMPSNCAVAQKKSTSIAPGGNSKPTSASRSAQPPSKAATATNPPFAAGTQLSSSNQPSNQSTSTATPNVVKSKLSTTTQLPNGPAVAITSGTQSSAENKHAQTSPALKPSSNVKVVYSQAYLKARTSPTTAVEGASKENGLDAGDSTTLLLQKATEVSDELTGKDLDTEMEKLRDLAKRIDSQKFCDMYRNRMESV